MHRFIVLLAVACQVGSTFAWATDVPITGLKLIVVDKLQSAGKAKTIFVAKDPAISKGAATDPAQLRATLDISYDAASGRFLMPQGGNWVVNSDSVGKYVNKNAPTGGAVKVGVIKPGTLVKVVGKSLGDTPLDPSSAPSGPVYVAATVENGTDTTRLCTQFAGCVHKAVAGDTGSKLICKGNSTGDAACTAAGAGCEADITSDVLNCGACGNACPTPANATAVCVAGVCTLGPCDAGHEDCDGNPGNGCEADFATDLTNCGGCGNACAPLANAAAACIAGVCTLGTCDAGYDDCDGFSGNGCEIDLTADLLNCGACGSACPVLPNGTEMCADAICTLGTCDPGYDNCDGDPGNGCETDLTTDPINCGACGTVCPILEECSGAICVLP